MIYALKSMFEKLSVLILFFKINISCNKTNKIFKIIRKQIYDFTLNTNNPFILKIVIN